MNKRYDEFRIEEREHTPPVVVDRNGHERVTTVVERMLWQLVMRDADKAKLLAQDARILELENLYHAVNHVMVCLGAHGTIRRDDDRVSKVMDALHVIDGGEYRETKTTAMPSREQMRELIASDPDVAEPSSMPPTRFDSLVEAGERFEAALHRLGYNK